MRSEYLYSVGGRIKFGETAEEAVIREVYEETGVHMEKVLHLYVNPLPRMNKRNICLGLPQMRLSDTTRNFSERS